MRLGEVIANAARLVRGSADTPVSSLAYDSRRVTPGALFFALGGVNDDGTRYIGDALARGAVAVVAAQPIEGEFPLAVADEPRQAMALSAANFYRWPASRLSMLGVTGTNGKTTVTFLLNEMARAAGKRSGLIGTVQQQFGDVVRPATHTTPESVELQALLAEMVGAGVELCAMEVSSHALEQHRVGGIRYRAAAFTQLTRDHLDYHGTMQAYFAAKSRLFLEHLAAAGVAVIGREDEWSDSLAAQVARTGRTVWRYGLAGQTSDLSIRRLSLSLAGFSGSLVTPMGACEVRSPLVGGHNVKNALAAAGLALAAGVPLGAVQTALESARGAPGRLERVEDPSGRQVFVDYAHSDDALARVLDGLRALSPPDARLICVFGCGGDRDRGKRPLMGEAAGRRSDVVVVTSDNPRTEPPGQILSEIVPGLTGVGLEPLSAGGERGYVVIEDRAEAIAEALRMARPGDVVLIAGKGHETYQLVGTEKRSFDDREIARAFLAEEVR